MYRLRTDIDSSEIWREGSVKHLTKPASLPLSVTFLGRDWRKGGDLRLTQRNGPRPPSEPRVRLSRGFFLKDPTITMTFEKLQSSIWAMSKGCLKVFFLKHLYPLIWESSTVDIVSFWKSDPYGFMDVFNGKSEHAVYALFSHQYVTESTEFCKKERTLQ